MKAWLKPAEWQLALPLALVYAAFFVVPLLLLVTVSAYDDDRITTIGFAQCQKFLGDPFYWKVIADTVLLGIKTVLATALVAYPLALVYLAASPGWQRVMLFVIVLPLLTSVVVRTFAWMTLLSDRGVMKQGMWADVVVFDPEKIRDVATYENPNQLSVGMDYVLVNGVPVIEDGKMTNALPGRVVTH